MNSQLSDNIAAETPSRGGPRRVLVIEDNSTNARVLADMLRSAGYEPLIAENGVRGLQMAHELQPGLILTDLQMPGMDGLTLTRTLKTQKSTAPIPVIAVTAHAMAEHRKSALEAGCFGFITKPFRLRALLAEVSRAFESAPCPSLIVIQ